MIRLSDYKDEEAIELLADLFDPFMTILGSADVAETFKSDAPLAKKATTILKKHKKEAVEILTRIDPTPINGLNIFFRLLDFLKEITENDEISGFFGFAEPEKKANVSFGSATENTGDGEN